MAVVPTPENGKPIPDFTAGTFDGSSLLFQSRNGVAGKIDGDQVATYACVDKAYSALGNKSVTEAIGKVLSSTLTAGNTTVAFSDASITTSSMFDVYVDDAFCGVAPTAISATTGSVTLTFPAQSTNMNVKVRIS